MEMAAQQGSPVVVLDPGHGGSVKVGGSSPNNAVGAGGLLEKDLTLDVATRTAALHRRRWVRWFRLAGHATSPQPVDFDDRHDFGAGSLSPG